MPIEELAECVGPAIITGLKNKVTKAEPHVEWLKIYRSPMICLMENYEALFEEELNYLNLR